MYPEKGGVRMEQVLMFMCGAILLGAAVAMALGAEGGGVKGETKTA